MPLEFLMFFCACFGAIVGSFLNAMAFRVAFKTQPRRPVTTYQPSGQRSACPQCGHGLAWYENIPLVSWLLLLGRCRHCRGKIPVVYWLAEIGFAAAFLVALPDSFSDWIAMWPALPIGFLILYIRHWYTLRRQGDVFTVGAGDGA